MVTVLVCCYFHTLPLPPHTQYNTLPLYTIHYTLHYTLHTTHYTMHTGAEGPDTLRAPQHCHPAHHPITLRLLLTIITTPRIHYT